MIKSLPPAVKHRCNDAAAALLHGRICALPNIPDLSPFVDLLLEGLLLPLWTLELIQVDVGLLMVPGRAPGPSEMGAEAFRRAGHIHSFQMGFYLVFN